MASVNKVILVGNLGADPEMKTFQSGDKVANLRIATSESWKDRNSGERQERTEWHSVAIFGPLAEIAERYLRKGSKVYLEGQLRTRKWQDQAGNDRYTTEVALQGPRAVMVMLDGAQGNGQSGGGQGGGGGQRQGNDWGGGSGGGAGGQGSQGSGGRGGFADDLDDDIPF